MPRILPVDAATATGTTEEVLTAVKKKMGMVPNIISTMAQSPAVANGYLSLSGELGKGTLSNSLREQIALTVGESNDCDYCLSAHTLLGKNAGLSEEDIVAARQGSAEDAKADAGVRFARKLVDNRGNVTDADLYDVRSAGYTDGEVGEIVANVALNIFTNYFNHVADPKIDFPKAPALSVGRAC